MSYNYLANQVPVPLVPSTPASQAGCTTNSTTAGSYVPQQSGQAFNALAYNQMLAQTSSAFQCGGGYGVLNGCALSYSLTGLTLTIGTGNIACQGSIQILTSTTTVPDNTALIYVWAFQNGTIATTTVTTPPVSNCVYIGNCTTSGGNITAVDYTGVCYITGGGLLRYTNDRSAPSDIPYAGTSYLTVTQSGTYHWNGAVYTALTPVTGGTLSWSPTITGTVTLTNLDNKLSIYGIASGGNQTILAPLASSLPVGWTIAIYNVGAANNLVLQDATGVTTLCTITPGTAIGFTTYKNSSGTVIFPGSTPWTPNVPVAAVPSGPSS